MTVHVLMPVFNRLDDTKSMLACLRRQVLDEPLSIVVVDDGSSDGTEGYLRSQSDVVTLRGDGTLWWGGAIALGLDHLARTAIPGDWVAFVNNDTEIAPDFLQRLLRTARRHGSSAVGSIIRDREVPHRILSIGPRIDPLRFVVGDLLHQGNPQSGDVVTAVDALSGRGVLFPLSAVVSAGGMRPRWLPHYLADYELSLRVKKAGWSLIVDRSAAVLSTAAYGSEVRPKAVLERLFSVRSPSYLPAVAAFWWQASSAVQRLTAPIRLVVFLFFPGLRRTQ